MSFYALSLRLLQMVWSDNDAIIAELNPVLEYLESCTKRSMTDILNKIDATLDKV